MFQLSAAALFKPVISAPFGCQQNKFRAALRSEEGFITQDGYRIRQFANGSHSVEYPDGLGGVGSMPGECGHRRILRFGRPAGAAEGTLARHYLDLLRDFT